MIIYYLIILLIIIFYKKGWWYPTQQNALKFHIIVVRVLFNNNTNTIDVGLSLPQHQRTITQQSSPLFPIVPIIHSCFSNSRSDNAVAIEKC